MSFTSSLFLSVETTIQELHIFKKYHLKLDIYKIDRVLCNFLLELDICKIKFCIQLNFHKIEL